MPKRKILAFGKGRPQEKKSLIYTIALGVALSACAHPSNLRRPTLGEDLQRICGQKEETDCQGVDTRGWVEPGETVRDKRCYHGTQFILTDKNLHIGRDEGPRHPFSFARPKCSTTDVREILKPGLVDWDVSDEAVYFLIGDGKLVRMTVEDDYPMAWKVPMDTTNAKTTYHAGFVFVATSKQMVVGSFPNEILRNLRVSLETDNPDFFKCSGRLFFGNRKEKVEIKINGKGLDGIQVSQQ